jgi:hypothetical protein
VRAGIGRRVDRRIATAVFGLAVLALVLVAALSSTSESLLARRDPEAALELFTLLRAGEHTDFRVDYSFTRVRVSDGQRLTSSTTEARFGRALLTRGGDSLTVELPTVVYNCQQVERGSSCGQRPQTASVPASEATGVMIALGKYDAIRVADATIAGEQARCFRVRARTARDEQPGLGRETTLCLAADGVLLRSRVVGAISIDERVAVRVLRNVDDAALASMFAGFDTSAPKLSR